MFWFCVFDTLISVFQFLELHSMIVKRRTTKDTKQLVYYQSIFLVWISSISDVIWLLMVVDGLSFNGVLMHQLTSTVDGKNTRMDLET